MILSLDDRRPREIVAVQIGIEVHHEVNCVAGTHCHRISLRFRLVVVERPGSQQAGPTGDNASPDAVAFLVLVLERAADGNHRVARGDPTPHGRVLQIVSRMTTLGGELHPAELGIRPVRSSLPCFTREIRQ